jgi:hypothetical protein
MYLDNYVRPSCAGHSIYKDWVTRVMEGEVGHKTDQKMKQKRQVDIGL